MVNIFYQVKKHLDGTNPEKTKDIVTDIGTGPRMRNCRTGAEIARATRKWRLSLGRLYVAGTFTGTQVAQALINFAEHTAKHLPQVDRFRLNQYMSTTPLASLRAAFADIDAILIYLEGLVKTPIFPASVASLRRRRRARTTLPTTNRWVNFSSGASVDVAPNFPTVAERPA